MGAFSEDESETEQNTAPITKTSDDTWIIRGNVELSEFEEATKALIENTEHDTVTGLAFHTLGYVPDDGPCDTELDAGPFHIRVLKILDHQVGEAAAHYTAPAADADENSTL